VEAVIVLRRQTADSEGSARDVDEIVKAPVLAVVSEKEGLDRELLALDPEW
jgi:hypothetical protein